MGLQKPPHLVLRGQTYYFRIALPRSLGTKIGLREWKASLGTSDAILQEVQAAIVTREIDEATRKLGERLPVFICFAVDDNRPAGKSRREFVKRLSLALELDHYEVRVSQPGENSWRDLTEFVTQRRSKALFLSFISSKFLMSKDCMEGLLSAWDTSEYILRSEIIGLPGVRLKAIDRFVAYWSNLGSWSSGDFDRHTAPDHTQSDEGSRRTREFSAHVIELLPRLARALPVHSLEELERDDFRLVKETLWLPLPQQEVTAR